MTESRKGTSANKPVHEYWPMATYRREDGGTDILTSYDGLPSKEKALDVIRTWADDCNYHLIRAAINVCRPGKCDPTNWVRVF